MYNDTKQNKQEEDLIDQADEVIEPENNQNDERIEALEQQVEDFKTKYVRALADYQNLERRVQEQRKELILSANRELLLRILPILDTLQLAKQHSEDKALAASIQQFLSILKSEGVIAIETVGKEFNPAIMECVTTQEGDDNIVLSEVRSGYLLSDKLLRSAQVIVGNGEEAKN